MTQLTSKVCFNSLIGIPYEDLNCWGIVVKFYELHNIQLPDLYNQVIEPTSTQDTQRVIKQSSDLFKKTNVPKYGTIIVMRIYGVACHVGVYVGDGLVLHTSKGTGSSLERFNRLKPVIEGMYDFI